MKQKKQHGNIGNTYAGKDKTKSAIIVIRTYPEDKEQWMKKAGRMNLSQWIINKLHSD